MPRFAKLIAPLMLLAGGLVSSGCRSCGADCDQSPPLAGYPAAASGNARSGSIMGGATAPGYGMPGQMAPGPTMSPQMAPHPMAPGHPTPGQATPGAMPSGQYLGGVPQAVDGALVDPGSAGGRLPGAPYGG